MPGLGYVAKGNRKHIYHAGRNLTSSGQATPSASAGTTSPLYSPPGTTTSSSRAASGSHSTLPPSSPHNSAMDRLTAEVDQLLNPSTSHVPKAPKLPDLPQSAKAQELGIPKTPPDKAPGLSGLNVGNLLGTPAKVATNIAKDLTKDTQKEKFDRQTARYRTRKPGDPRHIKRSLITEAASAIKDFSGTNRGFRKDKKGRTHVTQFSGVKTYGKPYLREFNRAAQQQKIGLNKAHKVTTPATRSAGRELKASTKLARKLGRPDLRGLAPAQKAVYPYVAKAHKKFPDIPKSVLYSLIQQESNFDPTAVSSANAQGLTQFIPSTAPAYGVKYGTSRRQQQSQVTGAAKYLTSLGFKSDPQGALSGYSGGYSADRYNNPILSRAKTDYAALDKKTVLPKSVKRGLTQAVANAKRLGISAPKNPARHAVAPGATITVKADGLGAVKWASKMLGTDEGTPRQARWAAAAGVDPSAPWCGVFVNFALKRMGVQGPSNPAYSGDWLNWSGGKHVNNPKPGDLVIFDWGDGGITDHIAMYAGNGMVIGGNQSDSVTKVPWDQGATVGIVRPNYKGGKATIPLSSLGGSTATGLGGTGGVGLSGGTTVPTTPAQAPPQAPSTPAAGGVGPGNLYSGIMPTAPLPEGYHGGATKPTGKRKSGSYIQSVLRRRR